MNAIEQAIETAVPEARAARLALYAAGGLLVAAGIAFAFWWVFIQPHELHRQAAQANADTLIQGGAAKAATDAMKITLDVQQHRAAIDVTTQGNQHAILSANGAAAPVDPALFGALHDALCLREVYKSEPDCAAVPPAGGGVGVAAPNDGSSAADNPGGG